MQTTLFETEILPGKIYLLDDMELTYKRNTEDVYTFNIINKEMKWGMSGLQYQTCIIRNRINELKIK